MAKQASKTFKNLVLSLFGLALLIFMMAFVIQTYTTKRSQIVDQSQQTAQSAQELFQELVNLDAEKIDIALEFLTNDRRLAEAMISRDRESLLGIAAPIFNGLKQNHRITHFYFHDPQRVNFLRVHKPDSSGDKIGRVTAMEAQRTQAPFYGIELGKFGHFTLRSVHPLRLDGELVGYVELGEEIEHILKELSQILGVDLAVTVHKRFLDRENWETGMRIMGREGNWDRLPSHALISHTMDNEPPGALTDALAKLSQAAEDGGAGFEIEIDGRTFNLNKVPLTDVSKKPVASMFLLKDMTDLTASFKTSIAATIIVCSVAGVLFFLLFYIILKRAEGALADSHESLRISEDEKTKLAAALEQSAEMVIITGGDGMIEYINPAFSRITGFTKKDVNGKTPRILKSGKHDESFYRELWNRVSRGEVWQGRLVNRTKDEKLLEIDATISPIFDVGGNISNYVGLQRDVTREAKLERQLRQTQKMEAIGTLAGGIAHDFNNILTAINGYTELARDRTEEGSEIYQDLDKVLSAGARAKDLVTQILTFSRSDEQELKPVHVRHIVNESLALLRASISTTIKLELDIDKESAVTFLDAAQMTQLLLNLCANADYAMRETGGVLSIGVKPFEVDKEFAAVHEGLKTGSYVRLTVSDSGPGMDSGTLDRIFEPFFTTKPSGEGTGMGLSIIHGIVKAHGGAITVYSEPGKGTTFHIYLPGVAKEEDAAARSLPAIKGGSEKVLYIDDEESIADMAGEMLGGLGYKTVICIKPEEALDIFRKSPDSFDLVITDQTMPGMTGLELAGEILRLSPDTPIILCTGYSVDADEWRAKKAGIREFVMKPMSQRALAEVVRRVLDS